MKATSLIIKLPARDPGVHLVHTRRDGSWVLALYGSDGELISDAVIPADRDQFYAAEFTARRMYDILNGRRSGSYRAYLRARQQVLAIGRKWGWIREGHRPGTGHRAA